MTTRTYDWRRPAAPDPRSAAYDVKALAAPRALRAKNWRCLPRLDQGGQGACVGFGWAHTIGSYPDPQSVSNDLARDIYYLAQQLDEWPGEAYEGTSALAGAKALKKLGLIDEYYWANSLEAVLNTLSWVGPVGFGCNWYEGMEEPDGEGIIHATGSVRGGHFVCIHGIRTEDRQVRIRNSWGSNWGRRGDCFLSWDDLEKLIHEDPEACVPVRKAA